MTQPHFALYQLDRRAAIETYLQERGDYESPAPLTLEEVRAWALSYITFLRGEFRRPMLTITEGQQLDYTTKAMAARRWLALPDPSLANPSEYPELYGAEAQARGYSPEQMATTILTVEQVLRTYNDQINGVAVATTTAVQAATTIEAIIEAMATAEWPVVPAIG